MTWGWSVQCRSRPLHKRSVPFGALDLAFSLSLRALRPRPIWRTVRPRKMSTGCEKARCLVAAITRTKESNATCRGSQGWRTAETSLALWEVPCPNNVWGFGKKVELYGLGDSGGNWAVKLWVQGQGTVHNRLTDRTYCKSTKFHSFCWQAQKKNKIDFLTKFFYNDLHYHCHMH